MRTASAAPKAGRPPRSTGCHLERVGFLTLWTVFVFGVWLLVASTWGADFEDLEEDDVSRGDDGPLPRSRRRGGTRQDAPDGAAPPAPTPQVKHIPPPVDFVRAYGGDILGLPERAYLPQPPPVAVPPARAEALPPLPSPRPSARWLAPNPPVDDLGQRVLRDLDAAPGVKINQYYVAPYAPGAVREMGGDLRDFLDKAAPLRTGPPPKAQLPAPLTSHDTVYGMVVPFPDHLRLSQLYQCPMGPCNMTDGPVFGTDRRAYERQGRALPTLFYGALMPGIRFPMLPKLPHDVWAYYSEESALNRWEMTSLDYVSRFDVFSGVSRHSDFPVTLSGLSSLAKLYAREPVPTAQKASNSHLALYMQSHAPVPSMRDAFVEELMKHVSVAAPSRSLHNTELPASVPRLRDGQPLFVYDDGLVDYIASFKFTLSFENANCEDYVTEKLWRPLVAGSVPVYKGSAAVRDLLWDPRMVILASDFASPAELASYLTYLDGNDTAYEEHLAWKNAPLPGPDALISKILSNGIDIADSDALRRMACTVCDTFRAGLGQPLEKGARTVSLPRPPAFHHDVVMKCEGGIYETEVALAHRFNWKWDYELLDSTSE